MKYLLRATATLFLLLLFLISDGAYSAYNPQAPSIPLAAQTFSAGINLLFGYVDITWVGAKTSASDNTTAIQAAINTGLPIVIPLGKFTTNGPLIISTPGQTVSGPGTLATPATWTPTTQAGVTGFGTRHALFFLTAAATNATFKGVKFEGSSTTSMTGTTPSFQPTFITSLAPYTTVAESYFHALPIRTTAPVGGIFVNFGQPNSSTPGGGLVTDSIFDNTANGLLFTATFGGGAVYCSENECNVLGSSFYNSNDTEVTLDSSGQTPPFHGMTVTGNIFDGGTYGVQAAFGALTVQGGSFGVTFSSNYVRSISNSVYVQNSLNAGAVAEGLVVSSNVFDMSTGAYSAYTDATGSTSSLINDATISNNQIINLTVSGACGNLCAGIVLSGAGYNITGNQIFGKDNTSSVLIRSSGSAPSVTDIKIADNKFYTSETTTPGGGVNIFTTVNRLVIQDNQCYGSGNAANDCVVFQGAGTFSGELRNNTAISQGSSQNYGNLYVGVPWGTFAYNALPGSHFLSNDGPNFGGGRSLIPATAVPSAGAWVQGDAAYNITPGEAGTAGSKYVVSGWINTVAGSPGTWLQQRTLTGN